MEKKALLIVGILVFLSGNIFADDEYEVNFPKNTITLDTGLFLYTPIFWEVTDFRYNFIGTAIQYERQILEKMSLAVRVDYRGLYIFDDSKTIMSAISLEAHYRYYPTGGTFFLDGMLGYANFYYLFDSSRKTTESYSHYFKLGGRLGWRIDFGKPGGFVLEPSFGYYGAFGKTSIEFIEGTSENASALNRLLNQIYDNFLINGFFVGGPQFSLGLGYRF